MKTRFVALTIKPNAKVAPGAVMEVLTREPSRTRVLSPGIFPRDSSPVIELFRRAEGVNAEAASSLERAPVLCVAIADTSSGLMRRAVVENKCG